MDNTITRIECSGCGRFFASTSVFNVHRIGDFAAGQRRCMTDTELREHGFNTEVKSVRFLIEGRTILHAKEVWFDVEGREKMREYFQNKETPPEPQ